MCHEQNSAWTNVLPTVLLRLRDNYKDDTGGSKAEMLHGATLTVSGELIVSADKHIEPNSFIEQLRP